MDRSKIREHILALDDTKLVPFYIPEWDLDLFIKPLDGDARFAISQIAGSADLERENPHVLEAYVCFGLVDEVGDRIFEAGDRVALGRKDPIVIERIYDAVRSASGMMPTDVEDAEKK